MTQLSLEEERELFWENLGGPQPQFAHQNAGLLDIFKGGGGSGAKASDYASKPVLKLGSTGEAVEEIQRLLNKVSPIVGSHGQLKVDGKYGSGTSGAVKSFQEKVKLPKTGTADASTWAALFNTVKKAKRKQQTGEVAQQATTWLTQVLGPGAQAQELPAGFETTEVSEPEPTSWTPYIVGGVVILGLLGGAYYVYTTREG